MSTTVTEREIRSGVNGHRPRVVSPPVRAGARARIPVTVSAYKIRGSVGSTARNLARAGRRWWAWTARPLSLRAAWRLSAVDPKRVPLRHSALTALWRISNVTDRLVMFALALAAPTVLTGPLRWLAARPTRRFGFYLIAVAAAVFALVGRYAGKE